MKQYISKSTLVAEIEKRITNIKEYCVREGHDRRFDVVPEQLSHILSFIDTLEVKEVDEEPTSNDLEEAACEYDNSHIDDNNLAFKAGAQWQKEQMGKKVDLEKEVHNAADQYDINNSGNIYWEDIVGFAKHFFELGLKAQKGE